LIRDRYVKHFPLAIIVARSLIPGSVHIVPVLFVKNVSDRPILVSWENSRDPNQLRIARISPDNTLGIDLRWRFAQPRIIWKVDRKIAVRITKRDLDYMI